MPRHPPAFPVSSSHFRIVFAGYIGRKYPLTMHIFATSFCNIPPSPSPNCKKLQHHIYWKKPISFIVCFTFIFHLIKNLRKRSYYIFQLLNPSSRIGTLEAPSGHPSGEGSNPRELPSRILQCFPLLANTQTRTRLPNERAY